MPTKPAIAPSFANKGEPNKASTAAAASSTAPPIAHAPKPNANIVAANPNHAPPVLEAREYEGRWWLPEHPDDMVTGTLHFSQDDIELKLVGAFKQAMSSSVPGPGEIVAFGSNFGRLPDQPRITGVIRGDQYVSLEQCTGFGVEAMLPARGDHDLTTTTYRPQFVLVGARYDADEEVLFDEISVRFSDLEIWVARSGFSQSELTHEDSGTAVTVRYRQLDPIEVRIDDETVLRIEFPWSGSGLAGFRTETRITQWGRFRLCFGTPANIERALTYVTQLRGVLALAVGQPIRVLEVKGHHNAEAETGNGKSTAAPARKIDVELLYRLVGLPTEPKRKPYPDEMLFTLRDAEPRLAEILRTWFRQQELLGPVLIRYFHLIHNPVPSREHEFESLVRVLETHHRRIQGAAGVDEAHRARLDRLYSVVRDEDDLKWLKTKLAFSHEPTLKERLRHVVDRCPTVSERLIGSPEEFDAFTKLAGDTRNYETHLDPALEAKAATGVALVVLVYQLRALVQMTLLLDIGFTCEQIDAMFDGMSRRYDQVTHLREQST